MKCLIRIYPSVGLSKCSGQDELRMFYDFKGAFKIWLQK